MVYIQKMQEQLSATLLVMSYFSALPTRGEEREQEAVALPESMLSEGGAVSVVPLFEMDTGLCLQGGT